MTIAKYWMEHRFLRFRPLFVGLQILALALFVGDASAQSGTLPAPSGSDLITDTVTNPPAATDAGTQTDTGPDTGRGTTPPPFAQPPKNTPPPLPQINFFVALNGQAAGPFNQMQLQQMVNAGQLNRQTLVWQDGMTDWAPAGGISELTAMLPPPTLAAKPAPTTPIDATRYLTGVWNVANGKMPAGAQQAKFSGNITYQPGGTYTARVEMKTLGGGGQMPDTFDVTGRGTWTATMVGTDRISVSSVDDIQMTSKNTGQTQQAQSSDTAVYMIIDQNSLRDEFGNVMKRMQ